MDCDGISGVLFVEEEMIRLTAILVVGLSFAASSAAGDNGLGGSFSVGCIESCNRDVLEHLDVNFFSGRLKCKCFCEVLRVSIDEDEVTKAELNKFNQDGIFSASLERKRAAAFQQCFSDVRPKE